MREQLYFRAEAKRRLIEHARAVLQGELQQRGGAPDTNTLFAWRSSLLEKRECPEENSPPTGDNYHRTGGSLPASVLQADAPPADGAPPPAAPPGDAASPPPAPPGDGAPPLAAPPGDAAPPPPAAPPGDGAPPPAAPPADGAPPPADKKPTDPNLDDLPKPTLPPGIPPPPPEDAADSLKGISPNHPYWDPKHWHVGSYFSWGQLFRVCRTPSSR